MDQRDRAEVSRTRDQAGIGPHATDATDLVPLGKLAGIRVAEGDADIRGWEVCTLSGTKVGTVHELLVDRATKEIVMLDVDLAGADRHTLAPIRAAQIDRVRRIVILDSADLAGAAHPVSGHSVRTDTVPRSDDTSLRRPAALSADANANLHVEETVVERRPVVYEEVVVRRRTVEPGGEEPRPDGELKA
jgi:sporulation protein YlmC with PRC-barrel domain